MTPRVLYNYILTVLGLRKMLPGDILRTKKIQECHEPMVPLVPGGPLFLESNLMYCRKSVAEKLQKVASELGQKGLGLYIYESYRSPEEQLRRQKESAHLFQGSSLSEHESQRWIRLSTAGVGGGHQTGGAVDLTLCNKDGIPLDMGSNYPVKCPEMITSSKLSPEINSRRALLCNAMKREGFVNYPGEWWHFAFGDQMWAAYKLKRYAIYGEVSQQFDKNFSN